MATWAPTIDDDLARRLQAGQTLPPEWYTSSEIFDIEQRRIFERSWQYVGHTGLVQRPGDYFTAHAGLVPVVVVRDDAGNLNAFLNVCRHRANTVVQGQGNRSTLQCRYHAWTYGLDGSLRGAPHSDLDPTFDKCALALKPVKIDTVGPFIFVNPDTAASPLSDVLGGLPGILATRGWDAADYDGEPQVRTYDVECNWKINMENTECYHCPVLHPVIARTLDTRPSVMKTSQHNRWFWDYATRPKGEHVEDVVGDLDTFWSNYYAWPNWWLITRRNNYTLTTVTLPLSPERCRLVVEYWFPSAWDQDLKDEKLAVAEEVLMEDIEVMESIQRNMRARLGGSGQLVGNLEALIQCFETEVYAAVTELP